MAGERSAMLAELISVSNTSVARVFLVPAYPETLAIHRATSAAA